jgi:hypothetical protein
VLQSSEKRRVVVHPQEVYDHKAHCGDVTNGMIVDSLQILEKGWGDLHHYLNDRWYQNLFVADFDEGLVRSSPVSRQ